jgi:UPF0716 protein FxsA
MAKRIFALYVLVELAAVIALAYAIGFGWTVLLLLGTFALGLAVAGSQAARQLTRLRSGLSTAGGAASDGVLIALGSLLTIVPGFVTSVLGLILLLPPTRAVARPAVMALAARGLGRMPLLITVPGYVSAGSAPSSPSARRDYIDGEVLDVTDVVDEEPPRLPGPTT